jgi:hypothetical protein
VEWALIISDASWKAIGARPPETSRKRDPDGSRVIAEKPVAIFTEVTAASRTTSPNWKPSSYRKSAQPHGGGRLPIRSLKMIASVVGHICH